MTHWIRSVGTPTCILMPNSTRTDLIVERPFMLSTHGGYGLMLMQQHQKPKQSTRPQPIVMRRTNETEKFISHYLKYYITLENLKYHRYQGLVHRTKVHHSHFAYFSLFSFSQNTTFARFEYANQLETYWFSDTQVISSRKKEP